MGGAKLRLLRLLGIKDRLAFFGLISWEAWAAAWLNPDMQARRGWNERLSQ